MNTGSSSFAPIASYGFIALFFLTQTCTVVTGSTELPGMVENNTRSDNNGTFFDLKYSSKDRISIQLARRRLKEQNVSNDTLKYLTYVTQCVTVTQSLFNMDDLQKPK